MAKYRLVKDVKSEKGIECFSIFKLPMTAEVEDFAKKFVANVEGSVRDFETYAELAEFMKTKDWTKDKLFLATKPGEFMSANGIGPGTEEALDRALSNGAAGAAPAQATAIDVEKVSDAANRVRLARGIVEDISRCKYGVSISELAQSAAAYLDEADKILKPLIGGSSK